MSRAEFVSNTRPVVRRNNTLAPQTMTAWRRAFAEKMRAMERGVQAGDLVTTSSRTGNNGRRQMRIKAQVHVSTSRAGAAIARPASKLGQAMARSIQNNPYAPTVSMLAPRELQAELAYEYDEVKAGLDRVELAMGHRKATAHPTTGFRKGDGFGGGGRACKKPVKFFKNSIPIYRKKLGHEGRVANRGRY